MLLVLHVPLLKLTLLVLVDAAAVSISIVSAACLWDGGWLWQLSLFRNKVAHITNVRRAGLWPG